MITLAAIVIVLALGLPALGMLIYLSTVIIGAVLIGAGTIICTFIEALRTIYFGLRRLVYITRLKLVENVDRAKALRKRGF